MGGEGWGGDILEQRRCYVRIKLKKRLNIKKPHFLLRVSLLLLSIISVGRLTWRSAKAIVFRISVIIKWNPNETYTCLMHHTKSILQWWHSTFLLGHLLRTWFCRSFFKKLSSQSWLVHFTPTKSQLVWCLWNKSRHQELSLALN